MTHIRLNRVNDYVLQCTSTNARLSEVSVARRIRTAVVPRATYAPSGDHRPLAMRKDASGHDRPADHRRPLPEQRLENRPPEPANETAFLREEDESIHRRQPGSSEGLIITSASTRAAAPTSRRARHRTLPDGRSGSFHGPPRRAESAAKTWFGTSCRAPALPTSPAMPHRANIGHD